MSKIAESVAQHIEKIVNDNGCELVDVSFSKQHDGDHLTVIIDKPNGVNIDDCERVHKAIDEPLDELDPTDGKPYTLNVSSPGIDRPIVTDGDFRRNLNMVLEVKLFAPLDGKKKIVGKLLGFNAESIFIEENGEPTLIDRKLIAKTTKYIDF